MASPGSLACRACLTALTLLLLAAAARPSPVCPTAQGDSCREVKLYLWTRSNRNEPQVVTSANVSSSHFDRRHPTKMVLHGYASGMNLSQLAAIREEYLLLGEHNIFTPLYQELVDSPCYLTAVVNVDYIGKCLARFIRALDVPRQPAMSTARVPRPIEVLGMHLIGFSLGGQVAGFAAKHLRPEYLLGRISGLDPALPLFATSDRNRKLDESDAAFVDVVHTNAYLQGQGGPCGHLDAYMNGGTVQPGCNQGFFARLKCDHHRAPQFFAESIRSRTGFWGWPCPNVTDYERGRCPAKGEPVLVGAPASLRRSAGVVVVVTRSEAPFARGPWWLSNKLA